MAIDRDSEGALFAMVDANLDTNPKIRKAGSFGRQVFEFVLRRNALRGSKGSVPIAFVDPDYLADVLMLDSRDAAVTGVTKAVTARLIEIDEAAGEVRIVGWHPSWGRQSKKGKERTADWRARKKAKEQGAVTHGDGGDVTPSHVTNGDKSDAIEVEGEKKDPEIHTRARERHPAAGRVARRTWDHGAKVSADLRASGIPAPPWALMVDGDHPAWKALLDRACELLVENTADEAEQICRNRVDVAAAKVRAEPAEAHWFACTAMFSRSSFEAFAYQSPEQFTRKPARNVRERDDALSAVLRVAQEDS